LFFPGDEGFFPFVVVFEETGEVPGVFGFDFAADEELFGFWFMHGCCPLLVVRCPLLMNPA
jgi:hypothetical protein